MLRTHSVSPHFIKYANISNMLSSTINKQFIVREQHAPTTCSLASRMALGSMPAGPTHPSAGILPDCVTKGVACGHGLNESAGHLNILRLCK